MNGDSKTKNEIKNSKYYKKQKKPKKEQMSLLE